MPEQPPKPPSSCSVCEDVGICKYGVEFDSPTHDTPVTLDFADAWDKDFPYAFQVRRSEFDHILVRNAGRWSPRMPRTAPPNAGGHVSSSMPRGRDTSLPTNSG